MPEPTLHEVHDALSQLRSVVESKNFDHLDALDKDKVTKMNKALDDYEDSNQKIVIQLAQEQKNAEMLKEQVETLEIEMARSHKSARGDYRDMPEHKAMKQFVIHGKSGMDADQKALLRTDNDTLGGFLTGVEHDPMMIKKITEISPIRAISRVRSVSEKTYSVSVRNKIPTAFYEGEAGAAKESNADWSQETLNTFRLTYKTRITRDLLMNSRFDMDAELMQEANEAFAFAEGSGFVLADGVKKPEGFVFDSRVGTITSGTSGEVDADDYLRLQGQLKAGYNPVFVLSRLTLANLRTKKSTTGSYLFAPGLNGGAPSTIAGDNYVLANDMPAIAAGNKSVAHGDFLRGYTITDRTGMAVIRDEITLADTAEVKFVFHRWNNGKVVLPEAINTITVAA